MKKVYYFLKWNFTNMESFTKRYIAYFVVGIIAATVFGEQSGAFFIAPLLMAIDFTVDIVRSRYQEFKQEQQDIIDVISGSKKQ
jgi:hypothetical protein